MKPLRAGLVFIIVLVLFAVLGASAAPARSVYVAENGLGNLVVIDSATGAVSADPIPAGSQPIAIAITPDGKTAYVVDAVNSGTVSAIDLATGTMKAPPIPVGRFPFAIAITPDGKTAYVVDEGSDAVSVIDTATDTVSPTPIAVDGAPTGVAVTPDGKTAYVVSGLDDTVTAIDTATNTAKALPIRVESNPVGIAITPDGKTAYVTNLGSNSVSVIDTATNTVSAPAIPVGNLPIAIAITPDGKTAYVVDEESNAVSVIDTATNTVKAPPIPVGPDPFGIAMAPDGKTAYVAIEGMDEVAEINIATSTVKAMPLPVGSRPDSIAIAPDQPPTAAFSSPAGPIHAGTAVTFDASATKDPDSRVATYAWNFGDGQSTSLGASTASHTFVAPGNYTVALKVTDAEGCSTPETLLFTGQTALCSGNTAAEIAHQVTVTAPPPVAKPRPAVRLRCPRSAGPKGCRFKLQAIDRKPTLRHKAKPESAIAKAKIKAGKTVTIILRPKPAFAGKLGAAKRILFRETLIEKGVTRTTYPELAVVAQP